MTNYEFYAENLQIHHHLSINYQERFLHPLNYIYTIDLFEEIQDAGWR